MSSTFRWRGILTGPYRAEIDALRTATLGRVLPAFDGLEAEAEAAAAAEYERLGNVWGDGSGWDMADAAGWAEERGQDVYDRLAAVRQAILNMSAAALYHLYEQQAVSFLTREVITLWEESSDAYMDELLAPGGALRELQRRLRDDFGVDVLALPSREALKDLRLLANTVKHGPGDSADKLRGRRPELFIPAVLRDDPHFGVNASPGLSMPRGSRPRRVARPLAGEDLYVTPAEYGAFADAVIAYWGEVADALPS